MALKRDLAGWLDAKLTEIERRHRLDEKNSALLRAMAVKRFSKYSRATAGVSSCAAREDSIAIFFSWTSLWILVSSFEAVLVKD